ncbi:MAG: acyl-CoA dehydrogenase [Clostridia bacterium]|nr:acyl-CoA dehydrogenase [Clostridia bacterium]
MDFYLSKEHKMVQKMVREFAENEVKPLAEEIDEQERFPKETVEKMAKLGLLGVPFPKKYGGTGADNLAYAICVEELAKHCGTTSVIVCAHTSLCCYPIYAFGTEEQKMKYLPDLLSGRKLGAFGLTEPNAGSDAGGQQTIAELDESGENYILNGTKCFITNATEADVFVVFAMTQRGKGVKGISAFIVERGFPGFSFGKHERKMGIRGSATCDLIFEDCIVPKENLLGKEGKGFNVAMGTLDGGRVGVAAQALGIGEGAINEAVKYTQERMQFGKRISQFQNTQFQLADMQTRADAAQLLVYRAAAAKDAGDPQTGYYSSMAKLFAAEMASDVTRRAVQLFGGYGYTREYPVERMMRDAKITEIYEGTSEVQRMVISRAMGVK